MAMLQLWFESGREVELFRTCFQGDSGERLQCLRGRQVAAGIGSFQWTHAVQGLCLLLLGAKSRLVESGGEVGDLVGHRDSPGASLDYALSKGPRWLFEMFGSDARGRPYATSLLHRINPNRKGPGPVIFFLNSRRLGHEHITVQLGNRTLTSLDEIEALRERIALECMLGSNGAERFDYNNERLRARALKAA